LAKERETLERLLPGLDQRLRSAPLLEREEPGNGSLDAFRQTGGPGLVIPTQHGGRGATMLEAVRVQRAIGSLSPSLAIATTMHHFSVASLMEVGPRASGLEWVLLESIATSGSLLASGFAEGRPGQGILSPTMEATPCDGGFVITGSKKPCSLSQSMDLLTASVAVPSRDGEGTELAVALLPAADERIERRPFWSTPILAGAESDEVIVRGVEVPETLIVRTDARPGDPLDELQVAGFLWFELLMTASYLGVASALVERVLDGRRGNASERVAPAIALEAAMAAVEGVARAMEVEKHDERALTMALFVRYAAQDAIARASATALELLGGMAFIGSAEASYLASAGAALAFHPPARSRLGDTLAEVLDGGPLNVD
jgi:alkylation response protein AidB-like acyl-CoA dehydrogenase